MEQVKALNALEPFLALTKSATSPRAAADLIVRATSAPNTYIFTELLQTPQIQALASSDEFAPYLNLLQIFSYGTYSSYTSTGGLPELNDSQRLKLRQLSLLTLARRDTNTTNNANPPSPSLGYASLQKALDLPTRQSLEELVISAIYAGLLKAQLNPRDSLVQINSVSSLRDVAPTAIDGLLSSLEAWAGRCEATLQSLSSQMTQLRAEADRRAAQEAARAAEMSRLIESEQNGGMMVLSSSSASASSAFPNTAAAATASAAMSNPSTALLPSSSLRYQTVIHDQRPIDTSNEAGTGETTTGGGGDGSGSINNTKPTMMINNMLTVGGGSSFIPPQSISAGGSQSSSGIGTSGSGAASPLVKPTSVSSTRRGSEQINRLTDASAVDMDDDDEDTDGKKRKFQE
ncbi:COP9 signalosome complex subunit 7a [Madurella mycetomatis]|uniref:COP9 signalosome complex subunit 7a n=1 Tax=Madurella mycetomatis TaxID=100816 RepID=A0A175WJU8_9PEZI|nr:COP9 signalosome complex subunit 7a [Madurella mycetomatis]